MSVIAAVNSVIPADPGSGLDATRDSLIVEGSLTLTGSYGGASTHGDTLSFAGLVGSDYTPKRVRIFQQPTAGEAPITYSFLFGLGSTQANGVLIVIVSTSGVELTEGDPYPAALTNTDIPPNIRFEAWFAKNI